MSWDGGRLRRRTGQVPGRKTKPHPRGSVIDGVLRVDATWARRHDGRRFVEAHVLGERVRQDHRSAPVVLLVSRIARALDGGAREHDCLVDASTSQGDQRFQVHGPGVVFRIAGATYAL